MKRRPLASAVRVVGLIAALLAPAATACAQPLGDVIALGRGATSGAVCQAVRDYQDPLAQSPGSRAWNVHCLGWDLSIGRLYRFVSPQDHAAWTTALPSLSDCQDRPTSKTHSGVILSQRLCRQGAQKLAYLVDEGRVGRYQFVGQGFAQAADILEAGIDIVSGRASPPAAATSQTSQAAQELAAAFGGQLTGLASAQKAAALDGRRLMQRGYLQNSEWRFDAAETDFRALADIQRAQAASPADKGRAYLNLALSVSNLGRFEEADRLFAEADAQIALAADAMLAAEALNYRALHDRNQGRFEDAIMTARAARRTRASAAATSRATRSAAPKASGAADLIAPDLAAALNRRTNGAFSPDEDELSGRALVQDAEAFEIEGSSAVALKDAARGRAALEGGLALLRRAEEGGENAVELQSRLYADLSDLDLQGGDAAAAARRLEQALALMQTRHAGSIPVAALLMDLGAAEILDKRPDAAVQHYSQAIDIFKRARGSLGASADRIAPYFQLLIERRAADPAHGAAYEARFFTAAETLVSDAAAATVSRLAARVASGDPTTAGLVRAVDDSRRELAAAESRIADLQARNLYQGLVRTELETEAERLRRQLAEVSAALLAANPRYDQLESTDVSLSALQGALQEDEVFVKTVLLTDKSFGLLISKTEAIPYGISLSAREAVADAAALRAPMEAAADGLTPFNVELAHEVFEKWFGPVRTPLLAAHRLIYEPDLRVISLPVGVLVVNQAPDPGPGPGDYRAVAWLGAKTPSSVALSAQSFLQSRAIARSRATRPLLGFGDPHLSRQGERAYAPFLSEGAGESDLAGDPSRAARICAASRRGLLQLADLPDTAQELRVVAHSVKAGPESLVLGAAFSDQSIQARTDLDQYAILYFATHALLPMPEACLPEPALVTSLGDSSGQGLLTASDVVKLRLDAELVVLSACDTGGVDADGLNGGGAALGGLARAFIYAGARNLIVSHWSVDSAATDSLMSSLFTSDGASVEEALRLAEVHLQANAATSHPYFWAPFTVVGDGARALPGR